MPGILRTNVRLNRARLYIANSKPIKLDRQAKAAQDLPPGGYDDLAAFLDAGKSDFSKAVLAEESLIVIFGQEFRGHAVENLVAWGLKRGNVRFAYLGDHANSRGAADMGLLPRSAARLRSRHCARRLCGVSRPSRSARQIAAGDVRCRRQRRAWRAAHRRRQSGRAALSIDPARLQEHIRRRPGPLPHRDRGPGRRGLSRRQSL